MTMATIQFYQNKYVYPDYTDNISSYGPSMECTPVGINLRTGTIRVAGDMSDFMSCNYIRINRDGETLYAWIDDVSYHTANSFEVSYTVDAWRTYRNKVDLGVQYIDRSPQPTYKLDPLLGSDQPYPDINSHVIYNINSNTRVFVVQVRPSSGEVSSNTAVQPTPYRFYMVQYNVNNWYNSTPIVNFFNELMDSGETENIVTAYSIPFMDLSGLPTQDLPIRTPSGTAHVSGWRMLGDQTETNERLYSETDIYFEDDIDELMRVEHEVYLVVPEAGIINIPDELLHVPNLKLRHDVDLFSGASNYMLVSGSGDNRQYYNHSVRGSSLTSIPILSDPYETYISQNQNALATSLIGDVATVAGGIGMAALTRGAGGLVGGGAIGSGVNNIISKVGAMKDAGSRYSNPPAYLGTALAANFNNRFWVVTIKDPVDNASTVHSNFGYQYGKVASLNFPTTGYIKTEGCSVSSTDGSVPRWAIEEINQMFDNGVLVHSS